MWGDDRFATAKKKVYWSELGRVGANFLDFSNNSAILSQFSPSSIYDSN